MAEVAGHETGVAARLAKPGGSRVPQGVGGDALLEPRTGGGAADYVGEDCGLQTTAGKTAEYGRVRVFARDGVQSRKLSDERGRERLAARLAALAAANEQRRATAVEIEVAPIEGEAWSGEAR